MTLAQIPRKQSPSWHMCTYTIPVIEKACTKPDYDLGTFGQWKKYKNRLPRNAMERREISAQTRVL